MPARWDETLVIIAALAFGAGVAGPAEAAQTLWTIYLRVGPGPQFAVIQELPTQTALDVGECRAGWCQVQVGRVVGYVRQSLVDAAVPPAAAGDKNCFETMLSGHVGGDHVRICGR